MIGILTWSAVALAIAGAVFVVVLTLRRLYLARQARVRLEAEERLRPLALALTEDETGELPALGERDAQILALMLARYGRWVSGAARDNIARFFEATETVTREVARLRDRRSWRRATAGYVLGDMGSRTAAPALVEALADRRREVRSAAARSLGRLGAVEAVEPLVYALVRGEIPRAVVGQALLAIGPAALPALARLVDDEEPEVRTFAVELVGLLGDAAYAPLATARLRDSSAEVRAKAARALGRLGAEEAAAELRAALDDRIPFVRAAAANAIGMIADRDAAVALVMQARNDPFFDAAQAAARALGRIDRRALAAAAAAPAAGPHLHDAADLLDVVGR